MADEQRATSELLAAVEGAGCRSVIVPFRRWKDASDQVLLLRDSHQIDSRLYETRLAPLVGEPETTIRNPSSLIVAAVPTPPVLITFVVNGKRLRALAPNNPVRNNTRAQELLKRIQARLLLLGKTAGPVQIFSRTVAAGSGFVRYGRNNMVYVQGLGSLFRLVTLASNVAPSTASWDQPEVLHRCRKCSACVAACPTGAISKDRFLLYAERCVCYCKKGEPEPPSGALLGEDAPKALAGCMICQRVCPENAPFAAHVEEGPAFGEAATNALLAAVRTGVFPRELRELLCSWQMLDIAPVMLGNLLAMAGCGEVGDGDRGACAPLEEC